MSDRCSHCGLVLGEARTRQVGFTGQFCSYPCVLKFRSQEPMREDLNARLLGIIKGVQEQLQERDERIAALEATVSRMEDQEVTLVQILRALTRPKPGGEARTLDGVEVRVCALEQRLDDIEHDLACERNTVGRGGE